MSEVRAHVHCPECSEQHEVKDVEFLDCEENLEGHDVLIYKCPKTGQKTSAVVYRRR